MTKGPGETVGTVRVRRGGLVEIVDERGRPVLAVGRDPADTAGAMHGDVVVAARLRARRSAARAGRSGGDEPTLPTGRVVRVLSRAHSVITGTYHESGREKWVVPDDWRLGPEAEVRGASLGALPGEKVVLAVSAYPGPGRAAPSGSIVERLGRAGTPDAETLAIIRGLGLRDAFPEEAMAAAERLPAEVTGGDLFDRADFTREIVFTIDDAEARDLDDAISIAVVTAEAEPGEGERRRRLGVHIADVAAYVPPGSVLDLEAARRGTSVYLIDRVLPMFPPRLSNGLASLHPGVKRLTLSVLVDFDERGRTVGYEVTRSVIQSVARLTYDQVAAFLEDGRDLEIVSAPAPGIEAALTEMADLAAVLRRRRLDRGSLDFNVPEDKVKLDPSGRPAEIVQRPRNTATQLIEEFMIAANEAVADFLRWSGAAYVSRVHEAPFTEDLLALREFLAPLGYRVPTGRVPRPAELQAILSAAENRPESAIVHSALLRALPLARYSASQRSHYALASSNYLHFTSPIRRYPDLTVHRQVLAVLEGQAHLDATDARSLQDRLERIAQACSRSERVAEKAERADLRLKKTELALRHLGWDDEAEVVDVFVFGAFMRFANGIEGLVPAGSPGAAGLRVGQRKRAQVVRVDLERRHVDLLLVGEAGGESNRGRRERVGRR